MNTFREIHFEFDLEIFLKLEKKNMKNTAVSSNFVGHQFSWISSLKLSTNLNVQRNGYFLTGIAYLPHI